MLRCSHMCKWCVLMSRRWLACCNHIYRCKAVKNCFYRKYTTFQFQQVHLLANVFASKLIVSFTSSILEWFLHSRSVIKYSTPFTNTNPTIDQWIATLTYMQTIHSTGQYNKYNRNSSIDITNCSLASLAIYLCPKAYSCEEPLLLMEDGKMFLAPGWKVEQTMNFGLQSISTH